MAKILKFERKDFEDDSDDFLEALLELANEMLITLDRLSQDYIKDLEKIGTNEVLKRKFELQYPHICSYIKKRTAENWIT